MQFICMSIFFYRSFECSFERGREKIGLERTISWNGGSNILVLKWCLISRD
jgi:hypothetical protein